MTGKLRPTRAGWAKAAWIVAAIDWKQGPEPETGQGNLNGEKQPSGQLLGIPFQSGRP